ncbi:MAG: D-alanine--D-alanine ligase [Thermoleophilaceae bacterium]|nr:D-alanine--D-alanine ligase [Thermoleophilaceae bacterium]
MSTISPLKVLLLAGGRSSERDVSLASGEAVRTHLGELGHTVRSVEIDQRGRWLDVTDFGEQRDHNVQPIAIVPGSGPEGIGVDVVFPLLHGPFGEDGSIQGLLESIDVPYVGAGVAASATCLDKLLFKDLMAKYDLAQVRYRAVEATKWRGTPEQRTSVLDSIYELGMPVFVKPARLGSSVGISCVTSSSELEAAIERALAHDPRVIVEAAAKGEEIECAVLGNHEVQVSQPGRIEFDTDWYDFDSKYEQGGMRLIAPAPMSESLEIEICSLAASTYKLAGCSGLARVDFFVDGDNILVNELNTMPGFTPTSVFPQLFEASGLPYGEVLQRLLELALERHRSERSFQF